MIADTFLVFAVAALLWGGFELVRPLLAVTGYERHLRTRIKSLPVHAPVEDSVDIPGEALVELSAEAPVEASAEAPIDTLEAAVKSKVSRDKYSVDELRVFLSSGPEGRDRVSKAVDAISEMMKAKVWSDDDKLVTLLFARNELLHHWPPSKETRLRVTELCRGLSEENEPRTDPASELEALAAFVKMVQGASLLAEARKELVGKGPKVSGTEVRRDK